MTVCVKGSNSDVHVERGEPLCLVCRRCILWADQKDLNLDEAEDMVQHLRDHVREGHQVPAYALRLDRLDRELMGGFDWSALFTDEDEPRGTSDREPYVDLLHRVISGLLTRLSSEQKARKAWYEEAKRWQSLYQATQKPLDPFPKVLDCDGSCWSKGCENPASGPPAMWGLVSCFLCAECASVYSRGEADMVWWKDTDGRIHPPKRNS